MMSTEDIQQKVKEYEQFIEERLKRDLKDIELILNEKVSKYKEWEEVKEIVSTVRDFKERNRDMPVRVDIGDGVMANCEITDYEKSYVCIGLGYMLEMDCDEADRYSDIRQRLLKKEIDHFRKMAVDVKVNIKMVLLAINELQESTSTRRVDK